MLAALQALDPRVRDTAAVLVPNTTVIATVNLAGLNQVLSAAAAAVTIAYTIWVWRRKARAARERRGPGRYDFNE